MSNSDRKHPKKRSSSGCYRYHSEGGGQHGQHGFGRGTGPINHQALLHGGHSSIPHNSSLQAHGSESYTHAAQFLTNGSQECSHRTSTPLSSNHRRVDESSRVKSPSVKYIIVNLNNKNYKHLREYLGHDVKVVEFSDFRSKDVPEKGYTPLVIDGASGVGKTQQAFALLKKHEYLIYVVMTGAPHQEIYKNVNTLLGQDFSFATFHLLCDLAIAALKNAAKHSPKKEERDDGFDYLSADFIESQEHLDALNQIRDHLLNTELHYKNGNLYRRNDYSEKPGVMDELKGKILFVDEALPPNGRNDKSIQRLKLVRNFGRAFEMYVCLAGTSSVYANMCSTANDIAYPAGLGGCSRIDFTPTIRWMDFSLYWQPMKDTSMEGMM